MPTCSIWVHGGALGHGGIRRCEAVVAALSNMDRESVIALFRNLENPTTHARFFEHVADDVDWTVEGTHPLAGRYLGKQAFLDATFARLDGVLSGGVHLEVEHVFVDGETAIVELYSTSTTNRARQSPNATAESVASTATAS
jgi:ketosteroid isomerase-like protein